MKRFWPDPFKRIKTYLTNRRLDIDVRIIEGKILKISKSGGCHRLEGRVTFEMTWTSTPDLLQRVPQTIVRMQRLVVSSRK